MTVGWPQKFAMIRAPGYAHLQAIKILHLD
jgi:hypothetical protein